MRRPPFTVADQALWDDVARTLTPLRARPALRGPQQAGARPLAPLPRKHVEPHRSPSPLVPFERRFAQRLLRGQLEPDARVDLHGEIVETARITLLHFLQAQYHLGNRLVLVITGKGGGHRGHTLHSIAHRPLPEHQGRLRRELPLLLHEAQFRALVVGFQPAHPRHGGGGAFYLKLRRA